MVMRYDARALTEEEDKQLAKGYGVSYDEIMRKKQEYQPTEEVLRLSRKLLDKAIEVAQLARVLLRRNIIDKDTEVLARRVSGQIGLILGCGNYKVAFSSIMMFTDEDEILEGKVEEFSTRKRTRTLLREIEFKLREIETGSKALEMMIPKESDQYILETPYLALAVYIRGISESTRNRIR